MDSRVLHKRSFWATVFLVLLFSALSARIVYIQIVSHERFSELALAERMLSEELPQSRGLIFDRNKEPLVQNQFVRDVIADRYHLTDIHVCRRGVAASEGVSVKQIARKYDPDEIKSRFIVLAENLLEQTLGLTGNPLKELTQGGSNKARMVIYRSLDFVQAEKIKVMMKEKKIGGFHFEDSSRRYYPNHGRLVQVLGYTDATNVGKEGIEKVFDSELGGFPGYRHVERTRRSSEVLSNFSKEIPPINGANIDLTIDMGLQNIVEEQLEYAVNKYSPEKIMAVFINPETGEILAMASRPHFNQFTRDGVRKIHPISDRYEPGSTFKIVSLAGAYDRGLVGPDTMFNCHNGYYREVGFTLRDHRGYQDLSSEQILAKSSNIGAYKLAKLLGRHSFYNYIKDFGFTKKTGVELTAESSGTVTKPDSSIWSKSSLSRIAMGYEVDVTALQMVAALSVIANGGVLLKPQIIKRIQSSDGVSMHEFKPQKVRRVIHENAANMVKNALVSVVEKGGTGTRAALEGYVVAGKTGTAKKPRDPRNLGYHSSRYVVSFMGFLPADNPKLAGIIIVDDPKGDEKLYGGTVAAPVFKEIAMKAMPYLGVEPLIVHRKAARTRNNDRGGAYQNF